MTKLGQVILRDTRANQPAAGVEGRLYYVTDESVLERDSGSAWQSVSAGFTNPMTTAGDIIKGGVAGAPQRLAIGSAADVLTVSGGAPVWAPPATNGTVTSVAQTVPAEFAIAGSPITTSGTLAITKANQNANLVWAGPTSGAAAAPTFRALVAADYLDTFNTGAAGVMISHFFNNPNGTASGGQGGLEFNQTATGGYTVAPVTPPTTDAIGVLGIGSNAASGAASGGINTNGPGTNNTLCFGGITLDMTWRFRLNALPASGQDYFFMLGFASSRSLTPTSGAFMWLDFVSGFTDFRYRTRSASTSSNAGSGLTAAADTWYKLRIQIDTSGNVIFTIDGANSQTISTNVPSGTGAPMMLLAHHERISGTNNRILYLDYARLQWSGGPS